jgi:hypothetical protein
MVAKMLYPTNVKNVNSKYFPFELHKKSKYFWKFESLYLDPRVISNS